MICPKCDHQQENTVVCESCDIYFEKYRQSQELKDQFVQSHTKVKVATHTSVFGFKKTSLLLLAGLIGYFFWNKSHTLSDQNETLTENIERGLPQSSSDPATPQTAGVATRLNEAHFPRNNIESSRNATVFIETSWGSSGSGFIISEDCLVITNRHVMEMDIEKAIKRKKADPVYGRSVIKKLLKQREELQQLNAQYRMMLQLQGKSPESEKLKQRIDEKAETLRNMPAEIEEKIQEQVEESKREGDIQGFTVSLVDETSYKIHQVEFSDNYDLALFQLDDINCPYLQLNKDKNLQQGTQLYTIGNPSGLLYTVTSGIFSGYRDTNEKRFIQTDAPINPGNSGGPLITKDGKLVGVNTSILLGTEGIGFAIPAAIIKQEFGDIVSY